MGLRDQKGATGGTNNRAAFSHPVISNCTRTRDGDTVGISERVVGIQHLSSNRCATDADLSSWLVIDWCHDDRELPHGFNLTVKGRQLDGRCSMKIHGWNAG